MKTIEDVTRDEWAALAEAAIDLLGCARLMFWMDGGDSDKEDKSVRMSLDRMADKLAAVGLPQGTIEEFENNLESMLRSGIHPEEWRLMNEVDLHDARPQ